VTSLYCTEFFTNVLHDTSIALEKLFTCEQLLILRNLRNMTHGEINCPWTRAARS
jgi:hypothetical protein